MSDADTEARLRVLEEIAASTKQTLIDMHADLRDMRREATDTRREMNDGFTRVEQRRERDFRLLFAAIIVTAIGLASLIARSQHWI
jgi:hypothetical protein